MEETKREKGDAFVGLPNESEYKEDAKPVMEKKPKPTWGVKALKITIFILVIWAILLIVSALAKILGITLS